MAKHEYDFNIIYNRALSPLARTDDEVLSLKFTEFLTEKLGGWGYESGYFADRDAIPGKNIFVELQRVVKNSYKTIVIVTPGFSKNCWSKYSQQTTFKSLLDKENASNLILISLDVPPKTLPEELNIQEALFFGSKSYKNEMERDIIMGWNKLKKAFKENMKVSEIEPTQEFGDDLPRTEKNILLAHPSPDKVFLSDRYLRELARNFAETVLDLGLNLDLTNNKVGEIIADNRNSVVNQAYEVLLCWRRDSRGGDEVNVNALMEALQKMGRKDLVETMTTEYTDFIAKRNETQDTSARNGEGHDETDSGSGQTTNTADQGADRSVTSLFKQTDFSTKQTKERQKATTEVVVNLDNKTLQASTSQNSSMSIPQAPIVKMPTRNQGASNMDQAEQGQSDEQRPVESEIEPQIAPQQQTALHSSSAEQSNRNSDELHSTSTMESLSHDADLSMDHLPSIPETTGITNENQSNFHANDQSISRAIKGNQSSLVSNDQKIASETKTNTPVGENIESSISENTDETQDSFASSGISTPENQMGPSLSMDSLINSSGYNSMSSISGTSQSEDPATKTHTPATKTHTPAIKTHTPINKTHTPTLEEGNTQHPQKLSTHIPVGNNHNTTDDDKLCLGNEESSSKDHSNDTSCVVKQSKDNFTVKKECFEADIGHCSQNPQIVRRELSSNVQDIVQSQAASGLWKTTTGIIGRCFQTVLFGNDTVAYDCQQN